MYNKVKVFTATGMVLDNMGRVLLVKNKLWGWLPPGGHVEPDELPCEACIREIYEETGLRADIIPLNLLSSDYLMEQREEILLPRPFAMRNWSGDAGEFAYLDYFYICKAVGGELTAQEDEVDSIGWFAPDIALEMVTLKDVRHTMEAALSYSEAVNLDV